MINSVVENWHGIISGANPEALNELLADDVVFYSPVVFTPQRGKAITAMYLLAAFATLAGPDSDFHYVKEVLDGNTAALEFESTIDGKYVNGVDIITCDDAGKIIEFKVMIRPLQAINAIHEKMRAALEAAS
ncbi:nuclear transport factor 2 family protein [Mycobacteroides salmoniphilum]|uniref:nuclear transport factor 2 family protein n=1 Tax=Mycobacteroides salmoniphilum TaxID=404941 RepID=UPI001065138D|nr:nuclear transport factor 2 family protein [Mycobacteroides salmoniphilum]TDZ93955.1 SnoaL-like domain protein [Mycobacteroides salmoniphilum]